MSYKNGKGTEKNLERAFYWYQKAVENGNINAQYNLATLYYKGEGTEKNLEKAFYWYQKAAENGVIKAQFDLAVLYENGEGIEKNLERAFHWYQKAATNDLKTIQKDFEYDGIFCKILKLFEPMARFIVEIEDDIYNKCNKCFKKRRSLKENHQICIICYQANLLYKPSGNKIIDKFINCTQVNFVQESSRMKFIPYDQFKDIKRIGKGGFSEIYKATWINGPPYWNEEKEDFEYKDSIIVALKQLNNSKDITCKELNEVQYINLI